MADQNAPQMQATLGLTGLTSNAMALIAPGAFLWLTFAIQANTGVAGQPSTAPAMWIGIFAALLLCLATAVAYAEISKLYPGTGSSYYYAEQAMLSQDKGFKYARISKFIVGWGSHLYYWVYPGVMVATTGIFCGYIVGFLYPNVMSGSNPGPLFMALIAVVFSFFVAWIASKGAGASTAVNLAINVIQISALVVFSVLALGYRSSHPAGSPAFQYDSQIARDLYLSVRHRQRRINDARRNRHTVAVARFRRQARSLHHRLHRERRHRQLPRAHLSSFRGRAPQAELHVHSGNSRHPHPGRLRIGHFDGRRGQKSNQTYTYRRYRFTPHSGIALLPV